MYNPFKTKTVASILASFHNTIKELEDHAEASLHRFDVVQTEVKSALKRVEDLGEEAKAHIEESNAAKAAAEKIKALIA